MVIYLNIAKLLVGPGRWRSNLFSWSCRLPPFYQWLISHWHPLSHLLAKLQGILLGRLVWVTSYDYLASHGVMMEPTTKTWNCNHGVKVQLIAAHHRIFPNLLMGRPHVTGHYLVLHQNGYRKYKYFESWFRGGADGRWAWWGILSLFETVSYTSLNLGQLLMWCMQCASSDSSS